MRRSSCRFYWLVTIDHPPLNIFGPDNIPQLDEVITAIETDLDVKVVVFDSAVKGFFLTHYDFVAPIEHTTRLPPGPTGLQPLPDMLVRLSRAPVVSIASIRGRATGVGSELADHCKPFSSSARRLTSAESRRMMIALSACSRTSWNTQAATVRRTQRSSQESCCQIF